ncbi:MAG: hypothetical protein LBR60_06325 [Fibrobacter sp.]|jgi:outer membrane biosynthesis protein TonB|nr:hypothetical protein [Fibrobacter sp.]
METLLFVALIAGVNIFIAWQKQKKKHARGELENPERDVSEKTTRPVSPLEELLRKFEEAQMKREQEAEVQPPVVEKAPPAMTKKETPKEVKTLQTEVKKPVSQVKPAESAKPAAEVKKTLAPPTFMEPMNEGVSEIKLQKKTQKTEKDFTSKNTPMPNTPEQARSVLNEIQFNREGFRQGFLWSKILDEPRFRNRWYPRS